MNSQPTTSSMERSYTTMDKSEWGAGPWMNEPDKVQWVDEATDLDCLAVRNRLGAWCGYVGLPPGHRFHGASASYSNDDLHNAVDVHGGITFADSCDEKAPPAEGICHIPFEGRPGDVWWIGFDCAHSMDVVPAMEAREREQGMPAIRSGYEAYRTLTYVRDEVADMARQLEKAA